MATQKQIDKEVVSLRSKGISISEIARSLNRAGMTTLKGKQFTAPNVHMINKRALAKTATAKTAAPVNVAPPPSPQQPLTRLYVEHKLFVDLYSNLVMENKLTSAKDVFDAFGQLRGNK